MTCHQYVSGACAAVFALVMLAADVSGQSRAGTAQSPQARSSRDSLKNGAIIGAVVGAAALGTLAAVICGVEHEPGTRGCASDTVRFAAIGAGIGIGAGVAVDAALTRRGGVLLRIRFRL